MEDNKSNNKTEIRNKHNNKKDNSTLLEEGKCTSNALL